MTQKNLKANFLQMMRKPSKKQLKMDKAILTATLKQKKNSMMKKEKKLKVSAIQSLKQPLIQIKEVMMEKMKTSVMMDFDYN